MQCAGNAVERFIEPDERTVLSWLLRPEHDQLARQNLTEQQLSAWLLPGPVGKLKQFLIHSKQ
jgi:hypothetical protein